LYDDVSGTKSSSLDNLNENAKTNIMEQSISLLEAVSSLTLKNHNIYVCVCVCVCSLKSNTPI
jgi:hypothetical protein